MTTLAPCNTCAFRKSPCAERDLHRREMRLTSFTSVRFACQRQREEYRPGRRVMARIVGAIGGSAYWGDDGYATVILPATIIHKSSKRDRWVIWPDDDWHDRLVGVQSALKLCALRSSYLELLAEPDDLARLAELERREIARAMGALGNVSEVQP